MLSRRILAGMYPGDSPLARPSGPDSGSRDYERIGRAIEFLGRNATSQPDLATVARRVHLSEHHFQRLFTRWAGVSPKRFLQFLTVEHAKARLAESGNVLDLAARVGLSGAGRLHDLFVTIEAMTPGEYREGGRGLVLRYGYCISPFGRCLIASTSRGICALRFAESENAARDTLRQEWPNADLREDPAAASALARRIFPPFGAELAQPLALVVKGTNFQLQVWRALLRVPFGSVVTYGDIARHIGHERAARAAGSAVGANPVAWLIPCHRVIRESGAMGGYRWGATRKQAMLGWEAGRATG